MVTAAKDIAIGLPTLNIDLLFNGLSVVAPLLAKPRRRGGDDTAGCRPGDSCATPTYSPWAATPPS